jgi:transketolase
MLNDELPGNWEAITPKFEVGKGVATRASSGQVLNAIAPHVPQLLGGSADLTGSNKTDLKGAADLTKNDFSGRYIRFGVREHGMGGILNGMALHGGIRPYGGTFLVFSDYMRGSVRLSALIEQPVIYVFTHDSIGLGEDGPTHQPIEHLMALRAIPNLNVIRPAEAGETAVATHSGPQPVSVGRWSVERRLHPQRRRRLPGDPYRYRLGGADCAGRPEAAGRKWGGGASGFDALLGIVCSAA